MQDEYADRTIIIEGEKETVEMQFDSKRMKDSEALHHVLCFFEPGDNYTIVFKNSNKPHTAY